MVSGHCQAFCGMADGTVDVEVIFHLSKCISGNLDSMVFCPNLKALLILTAAFGLVCF